MDEPHEHTLEFLLAFDGRTHWLEQGYRLKFEIKRTEATAECRSTLHLPITPVDEPRRDAEAWSQATCPRPLFVAGRRSATGMRPTAIRGRGGLLLRSCRPLV